MSVCVLRHESLMLYKLCTYFYMHSVTLAECGLLTKLAPVRFEKKRFLNSEKIKTK